MNSFADYKPIFNIDINNVIKTLLEKEEIQKEIIRYNQEQLTMGIDSLGQRIQTLQAAADGEGLVYSLYTYGQKVKKGQDPQNVTLHDTGELWQSMEVEVTNEGAIVKADTQKENGDVMENFDPKYDFFGLTKDSLNSFVVWVLSDYLEAELKRLLRLS
jgi:hypothetical protein